VPLKGAGGMWELCVMEKMYETFADGF